MGRGVFTDVDGGPFVVRHVNSKAKLTSVGTVSAGGKNLPAGNKKWPVKTTSTWEEEGVQPGSEEGGAVKDNLILVAWSSPEQGLLPVKVSEHKKHGPLPR